MTSRPVLPALAAAASLAACAQTPDLVQVHTTNHLPPPPADAVSAAYLAAAPAELEPSAPNSLWRTGARSFFNDPRASKVGDILTVLINVEDSAEVSNSTNRSRTGSTDVGVTSFLGQQDRLGQLLPPGGSVPFDPTNLVAAESESRAAGQGAISREERIELTVAAVVSDILPNGNLVVSGRQMLQINHETRILTVRGVIRPEDVGADNTVRHTQMADAQINYGGRGVISTVQRPRWGQRIADAVSPW